jgi:twinkle protein
MSDFTHHGPCSSCSSSDGVGWYSDGHGTCYVCSAYYPSPDGKKKERHKVSSHITPVTDVFRALTRRNIPEDAVRKYQIDVCTSKEVDVSHRYPYYKAGQHVANKVRKRSEKAFYYEGDPSGAELFGQNLFPPGSAKGITIVEGELDAPSAWVMLGSRYPVVSVQSAGSAVKDCKNNYEYLNSFEDIVICFDKDEPKTRQDGTTFFPGQEAAKKVAELFAPGKCRIMTLQHGKDPNEYRVNNVDPKLFASEWWKASQFTPDGLIGGRDTLDLILNRPQHFTVPYPWEALNQMTYGIRLSELMLFMADTGAGKTSVMKEIAYSILMSDEVKSLGYGVGFLHLEEPVYDTALGLLSIHNSKPYHLPDVERTREELEHAHSSVLGDGRAILYDSFGSNNIDVIINKIRHMVAMGCKYIFLDHLSIIVSSHDGDERKQLDEISTKLKTLTIEQDIAIFCVIHTNRSGQARGSAGPEKIANMHYLLERDKKAVNEWRRNVLKLTIEKNRFCGRTGPCLWMEYQPPTGRLNALDAEQIDKYEAGEVAEGAW